MTVALPCGRGAAAVEVLVESTTGLKMTVKVDSTELLPEIVGTIRANFVVSFPRGYAAPHGIAETIPAVVTDRNCKPS